MIHLIQKFLQYDRETPLYPDFSIESRGRRIVREISGMRNGDAAFLVFFRKIFCQPYRGMGSARSYSSSGCKNPNKLASILIPIFQRILIAAFLSNRQTDYRHG